MHVAAMMAKAATWDVFHALNPSVAAEPAAAKAAADTVADVWKADAGMDGVTIVIWRRGLQPNCGEPSGRGSVAAVAS